MHTPLRTITVHALPLLIFASCAAACSSAPDGASEPAAQSTEQAVTLPSCPKGYVVRNLGWDPGPTGKPIESWSCEADSVAGVQAAAYAGAPASGYSDACGSTTVATPASLPSTCTLGTVIDGQYFFTCPAGTVPPTSLGLVGAPAGLCINHPGLPEAFENCELVEVVSSLDSNCLGSPDAGWEFVVDATEVVVGSLPQDGGSGGGCPGGCATVPQPPLSRTIAP